MFDMSSMLGAGASPGMGSMMPQAAMGGQSSPFSMKGQMGPMGGQSPMGVFGQAAQKQQQPQLPPSFYAPSQMMGPKPPVNTQQGIAQQQDAPIMGLRGMVGGVY